jgi:hypothetical protein
MATNTTVTTQTHGLYCAGMRGGDRVPFSLFLYIHVQNRPFSRHCGVEREPSEEADCELKHPEARENVRLRQP